MALKRTEALPDRNVLDVLVPVAQSVVPDVEEDQPGVPPLHLDGEGECHRAVQVDVVHSLYLHARLCRRQSTVKSDNSYPM